MTLTSPADTTTDPLEGIHIVDCDAHFTEPADLWTYAPLLGRIVFPCSGP